MEKFICIHGHFYQPPRENAWLEAIGFQESAAPYHDWNERVNAESYAPNALSRILDEKGRIIQMVNNYSQISFNFGPTLLAWMEKKSPEIYEQILKADRESLERFSGHGSAIAQVYNHLIMPLANNRDKRTQVIWGLEDFRHRFKRMPEGMWLSETAVDMETLNILSEQGILFTILSPHQAKRFRPIGGSDWIDAAGGRIDSTMPYRVNLPSGRFITVFFYNGLISRAVAFEGLLKSGDTFAGRLMEGFSDVPERDQLVHIATDGESYGHHHRFGEMALSYALSHIRSNGLARITVYGEYLEFHPPTHEVDIIENTSWSCSHGIERWRSDCGCSTGTHPGWNQAWRDPLRGALDRLRDSVSLLYEEKAGTLLTDPWAARDGYIGVILERTGEKTDSFLSQNSKRALNEEERLFVLKVLELQRFSMFMYTSCGWFFDDIAGIETIQILQYAGRVIEITRDTTGVDLEKDFMKAITPALSNLKGMGNGRSVYENALGNANYNLQRICAHYATGTLFNGFTERARIYCFDVTGSNLFTSDAGEERLVSGKARLSMGSARVRSSLTGENGEFFFAVLHLGDHNLSCGVKEKIKAGHDETFRIELENAFYSGDIPSTLRSIDRYFEGGLYSLKDLFQDDRMEILNRILSSTLEDTEAVYRRLYKNYSPLIHFLRDAGLKSPRALSTTAEFVLNADLLDAFGERPFDGRRTTALLEQAKRGGIELNSDLLEFSMRKCLEAISLDISLNPEDIQGLEKLNEALDLLPELPFSINLWTVQNRIYRLLETTYGEKRNKEENGSSEVSRWTTLFREIGEKLSIFIQ